MGAGRHVHKAAGAGGAAGIFRRTACVMLSAETDSAVNSDVSIRRKGQSAVGSRLLPAFLRPDNISFRAGAFRGSGVEGVALVKGNQQSGTRRNSVAAGNGAVILQNDGLDVSRRRIGAGFGQIVKLSRANAKDCRGAGNKLRHQRHVCGRLKGIRRIIAHDLLDLLGCLVVPTKEHVAGSCCGGHSVLRTGGTGFRGFRCDFLSGSCSLRHGVAAAHRGLEGGGHIAGAGADQRQTCDTQGVVFRTAGRCQGDGEGCSVTQNAGVASARNSGNTAAAFQGIGKGQRCLAAGAVGQSQRSCNCFWYETLLISFRSTRDIGTAGRPGRRAFCVAGIRPGRSQAGDGIEGACRIGCGRDAGEQGEEHRQHQKHRANALDCLLHLFHSFHSEFF